MFNRFWLIILMSWACGLRLSAAQVETFQMETGESITGEVISADKDGLQLKAADASYQRTPWIKFSQESLKELTKNPKARPFVAQLIEATIDEQMKKAAIEYKPGPRLERPIAGSMLGALFASPLGICIFLVLYLVNLYAAYEVSIFRNHPMALACGLSAVVPFIGPIAFLCIPGRPFVTEQTTAPAAAATEDLPAGLEDGIEPHPSAGLALAQAEAPAAATVPPPVIYLRGQYMFNRRFFETKLSGFFRVVPSAAEKDMAIVIKSSRGTYAGNRISRISSNELFLQIFKGDASEEVMIPFNEVLEVIVKHRDT